MLKGNNQNKQSLNFFNLKGGIQKKKPKRWDNIEKLNKNEEGIRQQQKFFDNSYIFTSTHLQTEHNVFFFKKNIN